MEEKEALLYNSARHSRLVPQELCPTPSLVSRERVHSQAGVCDKDQRGNSPVFFSCSFHRMGTRSGCVQGPRRSVSNLNKPWPHLLLLL